MIDWHSYLRLSETSSWVGAWSKMPRQVLDSRRPGVSWRSARKTACHPSPQAEVCCPLVVLDLVFGSGICSAGAVSHNFSVSAQDNDVELDKSNVPSNAFSVPKSKTFRGQNCFWDNWNTYWPEVLCPSGHALGDCQRGKKDNVTIGILKVELNYPILCGCNPQLRKNASHTNSVYLMWKS